MQTNSNASHGEKDPVCGMTVEASRAAGKVERDGRTFYFCSTRCQSRFEASGEPEAPEAHFCCRRD